MLCSNCVLLYNLIVWEPRRYNFPLLVGWLFWQSSFTREMWRIGAYNDLRNKTIIYRNQDKQTDVGYITYCKIVWEDYDDLSLKRQENIESSTTVSCLGTRSPLRDINFNRKVAYSRKQVSDFCTLDCQKKISVAWLWHILILLLDLQMD